MSDDAFADDPVRRAVVEAMIVSIFGNAYSVVRNGRWLGTFADEETAKLYWPETSREDTAPLRGRSGDGPTDSTCEPD